MFIPKNHSQGHLTGSLPCVLKVRTQDRTCSQEHTRICSPIEFIDLKDRVENFLKIHRRLGTGRKGHSQKIPLTGIHLREILTVMCRLLERNITSELPQRVRPTTRDTRNSAKESRLTAMQMRTGNTTDWRQEHIKMMVRSSRKGSLVPKITISYQGLLEILLGKRPVPRETTRDGRRHRRETTRGKRRFT
jgi:hypothetical protein